jgi:hypothetical protein
MRASGKETATEMEPKTEVKTMACQEIEARQKRRSRPHRRRQKRKGPPKEDAEVVPVGEPKKKRRKDRKLAAERRHQMKERTQSHGGCRKRPAVARKGTSRRAKWARQEQETDKRMPRRATVARRKRDIVRKNLTQGAGEFPRKRLVVADKKMTRCASVTQRTRLRLQGDQLESRTSPHKDVSKRTREELGCGRMTQESVMKGKEAEQLKIERETIRRMRKQFEARASPPADVLRGIATNTNVKFGHCRGVDPLQNEKRETARMGGPASRSTGLPSTSE